MNTPLKCSPNLPRWVKNVTQVAVLLNTEKDWKGAVLGTEKAFNFSLNPNHPKGL